MGVKRLYRTYRLTVAATSTTTSQSIQVILIAGSDSAAISKVCNILPNVIKTLGQLAGSSATLEDSLEALGHGESEWQLVDVGRAYSAEATRFADQLRSAPKSHYDATREALKAIEREQHQYAEQAMESGSATEVAAHMGKAGIAFQLLSMVLPRHFGES